MEGALGERLKREYALPFDENVAMARLVQSAEGRAALCALWTEYRAIAEEYGFPFLATTPTRRANRERMARAGLDASLIRENVRFLQEMRASNGSEMYVGGLMGCRGDAYTGWDALNERDAQRLHAWQAEAFSEAGADFLFAGIMPTLPEARGMARAMAETGLPYIISFTIRRDGCLIDGTNIDRAIGEVDGCAAYPPVCCMANCVHPSIVREALEKPFNRTERVRTRFLGLQANTSPLDYDRLDGAKKLFSSPPEELAEEMLALHRTYPMRIFGGCCGTDGRHMREIAKRLCGGEEHL